MKAFITGITGFVGSHLAEYLLHNHSEVEVFGTKRWRSPLNNLASILNKIELIDCDLRDTNSVIDAINRIRPDAIFHLAAQSFVPASYNAPRDTIDTNVIGTISLLEAVRYAGIDPTIHICSSSEVYGQVDKEHIPITEDTPFKPASPYAVSKVAADMIGYQYFAAYGMKTIRTRAFTHTGPRRGEVFVVSAFAKQIVRIEKGLQPPVLYVGNLDSIRTFADVRDIARAYWLVIEKCLPGEVYNVGGTTTMSVGEMLDMLLTLSSTKNINIEVSEKLLRPADVTLQIPSIDKFQRQTGWKPEIPFETTLQDILDYWRHELIPQT